MWINIGAIFEALFGAALTFILHAALLFGVCGLLQLLWSGCKWIYRKITGKDNKEK